MNQEKVPIILQETIKTWPVLVVCPVCNDEIIVKDLKTLDETIHQMWQLSTQWMKEFFGESGTSFALASAGIQNKIEKQIEHILQDGFLKIICRTCMTDESLRLYKQQGIDCIRIGNMIFETKFYKKNRKLIQAQMKDKPHLFKKTFWT